MKTLFKILSFIFLSFGVMGSCKKDSKNQETILADPEPSVPTNTIATGSLKIEFRNMVDDQPLILGNNYLNPNGEAYTLTKFKYYVSNIILTKNDNSEIKVENVYQIIDQADDISRVLVLKNIPQASYRGIKFLLGVDSARNCSGAQAGGLDIAYVSDMYWSWSQGYIFLKVEGTSPTSTATSNRIEYHMGGFGGVNKVQRYFSYNFEAVEANVSAATIPTITLMTNVNEIFKNPAMISFATMPVVVSSGMKAKSIADNYSDMITLGSIHN